VWADDGEEFIDTMAIRWTRSHVLVHLKDDPRCATIGAWLKPDDVRRRR
jgi:hypothetical protein